mmetsp:Transcript_32741/g.40219  ORF Transcript_32741/g.40219 Transcript_32741/m.40219 type:complete len:424 (+) Transcript_32741:139-1410(+)
MVLEGLKKALFSYAETAVTSQVRSNADSFRVASFAEGSMNRAEKYAESRFNAPKFSRCDGVRYHTSEVAVRIVNEIEKLTSQKDLRDDSVSLRCLPRVMVNLGLEPVEAAFLGEIFYSLFDVSGTGKVSPGALPKIIEYLIQESSSSSVTEFGFEIFGNTKDGRLTKGEMASLVSLFWDSKLENLILTEGAVVSFYKFLERELSGELMRFYLTALFWDEREMTTKLLKTLPERREKLKTTTMPLRIAERLYSKFIKEGAKEQVNLSDTQREFVRSQLEIAESQNEKSVRWSIFESSVDEVQKLMESGKIGRFKREERDSHNYASKYVWSSLNVAQNDTLSFSMFREWTIRNPVILKYFLRIQRDLRKLKAGTEAVLKVEQARKSLADEIEEKRQSWASVASTMTNDSAFVPQTLHSDLGPLDY